MQIYLAPMEGITSYIVRNAFHHHFDCIDKYFTPFIPAAKRMNKKILRDLASENNAGIRLVPQLISNDAMEILDMTNQLLSRSFSEININLGCPSGTVVGKKRGSGMLRYPEDLDCFLDGIYTHIASPVSIKTRIGFDSLDQWPVILNIYRKYPMSEFIIHPRLRSEFYNGFVHLDEFRMAYETLDPHILCYNGDIWNMECYQNILERFPQIQTVMIGRGLLARPDLCCQIKGISIPDTRKSLRSFCDEIYEDYLSVFSGEKDAVRHMKEIWANLGRRFEGSEKLIKKMMKIQTASEYQALISQIFETLDLVP